MAFEHPGAETVAAVERPRADEKPRGVERFVHVLKDAPDVLVARDVVERILEARVGRVVLFDRGHGLWRQGLEPGQQGAEGLNGRGGGCHDERGWAVRRSSAKRSA